LSRHSTPLRSRYDYVFTSGGIGPTHDDITADAVANCLWRRNALMMRPHSHCWARIMPSAGSNSPKHGAAWQECRKAARHIDNPVSRAPGFVIGNVHVMAGVPSVFQAMLDNVLPTFNAGT
jgi:molybdopterin-biosynthesis enzyme MoeA-like protein